MGLWRQERGETALEGGNGSDMMSLPPAAEGWGQGGRKEERQHREGELAVTFINDKQFQSSKLCIFLIRLQLLKDGAREKKGQGKEGKVTAISPAWREDV